MPIYKSVPSGRTSLIQDYSATPSWIKNHWLYILIAILLIAIIMWYLTTHKSKESFGYHY